MTDKMGHVDHFALKKALEARQFGERMKQRIAQDPGSATRWMGDARAVFWFLPILFIFTIVIGDQSGGNGMNMMWLTFYLFPFLYALAILATILKYEKGGGAPPFRALGDAGLCTLPIGLHFLLNLPGWLSPREVSSDLPFFYIADFIAGIGTLLFFTLFLKALFPKKESKTKVPTKES